MNQCQVEGCSREALEQRYCSYDLRAYGIGKGTGDFWICPSHLRAFDTGRESYLRLKRPVER